MKVISSGNTYEVDYLAITRVPSKNIHYLV